MHHGRQRLPAAHVREHRLQLIVLLQELQQLLRLDAVLTRLQHQALGHVVLADLDLELVGDRVNQQLRLDRLLRVLACVGVELFAAAALLGQRLGQPILVVVEAVQCVMHRLVDLRLHDRLRQRHLHLLEQRLDGRVADLFRLLYPLEPAHLVAEARLQLVNGVEFACQLGEFVVQFRQLAFLDRVHRDGHLRALASVLTGGQRGGEHPALPRRKSDNRVVEALDELTRTHLVRHAFCRRVGNRFAVNRGRHVDRDDIALLRGPFHRSQRAEAGA